MTGNIQAIERAMAVLTVLGRAGRPLALNEIASTLGLAKPTAHGIVRTLHAGDFIQQDRKSRRYTLGDAFDMIERSRLDPHDLRSIAMGWTDSLAALTRLETLIAMPSSGEADVVHHVFRPDNSVQALRIGERLPLHATAAGKTLLCFTPGLQPRDGLDRFTRRTLVTPARLAAELDRVRERGVATDRGEFRSGIGGLAAPLRGRGGLGVAALEIIGPVDVLFDSSGQPDEQLAQHLRAIARLITRALGRSR